QCADEWKAKLSLWGEPESGYPLMQKLKSTFDPDHLLNPHRLFAAI
ncbi:MAG: FAD-linked oxidase C-terminal domain-containing protein, partial [Planctomycetaceae bacterium]